MKSIFHIKMLVTAIMIAIPFVALPQNYPEIMFIVDSSGSMNAPLQGRTKLAIAKDVLRNVVLELAPEVRMGLAAYGHRRQRDCEDVEILMPPGSDDRGELVTRVDALQPLGLTPITMSLYKTAEALQTRKAETTIVLLTDGLENCGGDPIDLTRKLKQTNVRFILHVVGYGIEDHEQQALVELAEAGDGRYFSANDTASLLAALETVRKDIEEKVEKAKTEKVQRKTGLGKLHLSMPNDALQSLAGIQIRRPGEEKPVKQAKLTEADSTHPLMSGEYELWLDFANPNFRPPTSVLIGSFDVNGGATTDLILGAVAFNVADGLFDQNISFMQLVEQPSGSVRLQTDVTDNSALLFKTKAAPAGTYDLVIGYFHSSAPVLLATNINVAVGKQATVTLDTGLVLKKPANSDVTGWDLHRAGSEEKLLEVRRRWDNQTMLWKRFIIPPGTYDLMVHIKGMDEPLPVGSEIEVHRGQTVEFDIGL